MFFQFSPPTRPIREKKSVKKEAEPDVTVLSLAPFTPNPKLFFENVKVGQTSTQKLLVRNPTDHAIQLTAQENFSDELEAHLSWIQEEIEGKEEVELEITWRPTCEGAWRYMLHLGDNKTVSRDVPVVFKSVAPFTKNKTSKSKSKRMPTFVSKKTKSPVQSLMKKKSPLKRSPQKRWALPDVTNIPTIEICKPLQENGPNGKENVFVSHISSAFNYNTQVLSRRDTYIVSKNGGESSPAGQLFDDSLETNSPNLSFAKKLLSESFKISPMSTPNSKDVDFNPEHCSTEEKSVNNTTFHGKRLCLFSETNATFDVLNEEKDSVGNVSTETYVKCNISSETYTKADLSSSTYVKDGSFRDLETSMTPPSASKKARLDSLLGLSVKNTMEADLWSNRASKPLGAIKEETTISETSVSCFSLKRKSELTFVATPHKKPNFGGSRLTDWSKHGDSAFRTAKKSSGLKLAKDQSAEAITHEVIVTNPFVMAAAMNPFTTSIVNYNEEWIHEQEENFKKWLNSLLTPPLELDSSDEGHVPDVAKIWMECRNKKVEAAPTREAVANKYHTSFQMNLLRKKASALYRSKEVASVLTKVEAAIEQKKISIRDDRNIHLDLGLQTEIMEVILSYNPLWLRLGLETVYRAIVPMTSNSDLVGLASFLSERFIRDPHLLKKYKTVYSPKYVTDLKKNMLKKFFALVYFLDHAKRKKLVRHDPCLFRKNSAIKESREALLRFSRDTLSAIGDITKYLKYFDYAVHHKQTYIDEFDYAVNHLGVDLRDGVRLTRVMEIILLESDLSKQLRVPAISRLQKIHNVKIVFDALEKSNFEILYNISPKDLVDGHKEKTLSFLWQIIYKFQTPLMVKNVTIIQTWWRSASIVQKREQLRKIRMEKDAACKRIQIWYRRRKFVIKMERWMRISEVCLRIIREEKAVVKIQSYVRMYLCRKKYQVVRSSVVKIQIQARKWLIYYSKKRVTAAVTIQSCVRMFTARRRLQKLKYCVRLVEETYLAKKKMIVERENFERLKYAVLVVQTRFRTNLLAKCVRTEYRRLQTVTILVQRRWRANQLRRVEYNKYTRMRDSARVVQRRFRATKEMRVVQLRYMLLKWASLVVQQRFRAQRLAAIQRREFVVMRESAIVIQRSFRAYTLMKTQFCYYERLKRATVFVQRRFRANRAMREALEKYNSLKFAAIIIQRFYRSVQLTRCVRWRYEELRRATVDIQRRFRARRLARGVRQDYEKLRESVVFVQRKRRALLEMRDEAKRFQALKAASVTVQRRFRANLAGKAARNDFVKLRDSVVLVQKRWRSKLAMRDEVKRYQRLRSASLVVQRRYRAKLAGKLAKDNYHELRSAVVRVQRLRRATLLMRREMKKFQLLKSATLVVQRRFRANLVGKLERDDFIATRRAAVLVQRKWRATLMTRVEVERYRCLRGAVLVIQRRFRAKVAARTETNRFNKLKGSVVFIQRKWRATLEMRDEIKRFQALKSASVVVQRRFRANLEARLLQNEFNKLKRVALAVQRRWRAKLIMRSEMSRFQAFKSVTVTMQRRFRATRAARAERDKFNRFREVVVFVQRQWRAKLAMRVEIERFQALKTATVIVQRRFRAKLLCRVTEHEYGKLREATVSVQRKWRAKLAMRVEMKRFESLKFATVVVQRRFRANLAAKSEKNNFNKLKETVVFVQRMWRAKLAMRVEMGRFCTLRSSVIVVQRRFRATLAARLAVTYFNRFREVVVFVQRLWRAKLAMRVEMKKFQSVKVTTVIIQRRFRAKVAGRLERDNFNTIRRAVVFVQRKWRAKLLMRVEQKRFQALKKATLVAQKHIRGFLVRQKYAEALTPEAIAERRLLKVKNQAATKIQTAWRGYKRRLDEKPEFSKIRERLQKANENAVPHNTLGSRCKKAVLKLSNVNASLGEIIRVLEDLEFITRRCKKSCQKLGAILPKHLYATIISTNRSLPEMKACTAAASILINFYRFEPTRTNSWLAEYAEHVISVMLHWCNKEAPLFPTLCTLVWLFAHNKKYKEVIISSPNFKQKMERIAFLCRRQRDMVTKVNVKYESLFSVRHNLPLPSSEPDWGLEIKNRPKIFYSSVQAIDCLLNILK
ncbi:hypothetical protein MTP99_013707 [Tenebrio molitor]|nr:hypothetical protein MTP99_013707 [Tenebrio molitor]